MTKEYNELVGLAVRWHKEDRRYGIENIYRRVHANDAVTILVQRSFTWPLYRPFHQIVRYLENAYAPAICNIWHRIDEGSLRVYLQFDKHAWPSAVFLPGDWEVWAE